MNTQLFSFPDSVSCPFSQFSFDHSFFSILRSENPAEGFALFPNPAHEQVTFEFDVTADAPVMLYLYGVDSRALSVHEYHFAEGRQSFTLPTEELPNGLISYRLLVGDSRYSGQFIKQD